MVITSTTGNRVVAKSGSRVRISPTPPKQSTPKGVLFVFAETRERDSKSCRNSPVGCCADIAHVVGHFYFRPRAGENATESLLLRQSKARQKACFLLLWNKSGRDSKSRRDMPLAYRITSPQTGDLLYLCSCGTKMQTNLSYSARKKAARKAAFFAFQTVILFSKSYRTSQRKPRWSQWRPECR